MVSEGKIICKKARFAGSWKFLAQLTNNCMQSNSHSNKQLQKQPPSGCHATKSKLCDCCQLFLLWGIFYAMCASRKNQAVKVGWAVWFWAEKKQRTHPCPGEPGSLVDKGDRRLLSEKTSS